VSAWRRALGVYADRRLLAILCMGFASGLPFALTGPTLTIWLREDGVSLTDIGFFALVGLSYNLKFLWSPIIDRVPLPFLTAALGRRRSWALVIEILLALAILALGATDPAHDRLTVALLAVLVAFLSASQDIVIDAYRVELLDTEEQGAGAAATQIGWRLGLIASAAGALYLAQYFGWSAAYAVMAACVGVGFVAVLLTEEPKEARPLAADWLGASIVAPFLDYMRRADWLAILVFVVLYKVGEAFAANLASPFYITLGFSKVEIANVVKVLGVAAGMTGVFLGGVLVARLGITRALLVAGVVQALSTLMYIVQLHAGHDVNVLGLTVAAENLTGGAASAAFVAYLSRLCSPAYTATQYALLSALAIVPRSLIAAPAGWVVDHVGWQAFFLAATLACLPGLALLLWLMRRPETRRMEGAEAALPNA
jgi:PAT family beta-lactamase induction signal transducer AmpG